MGDNENLIDGENTQSRAILRNFVLFCVLFSIAHATVDGVLAFAAAELGPVLGSYSGFTLYGFYTFTSLFFAKPFLKVYSSKTGVFIGLCGMLCYVGSFFFALVFRSSATPIFITGASLGGVGAGILWTSQSVYYSANAAKYSSTQKISEESAKNSLSSVFAACYLALETTFKMLVTLVFVSAGTNSTSWRPVAFGTYAASALISVVLFWILVTDIDSSTSLLLQDQSTGASSVISRSSNDFSPIHATEEDEEGEYSGPGSSSSISSSSKVSWSDVWMEVGAVCSAMWRVRSLQLLLPYQVCFGLSAGFVDFYINRVVVSSYIGDGYIGSLSAISTLSAVVLAYPFSHISNNTKNGKWIVMIIGGCCFLFTGLPVLVLRDDQMGNWGFLVVYFIVHGAARGVWESINKAVVADYFLAGDSRDAAFAAVYFTSGLAGACGFFFYQFMNRFELGLLNTIVPAVAIVCYHWSCVLRSSGSDLEAHRHEPLPSKVDA